MNHQTRIAELEAELEAVRAADKAERAAAAKSVVPQYAYSVAPSGGTFDRIYDTAVVLYKVTGTCLNQREIDAVGGKSHTGSMNYLFNSATGKIIMSSGGGSVFISNRLSGGMKSASHDHAADALEALGAFLVSNPSGGDITSIIEQHRAAKEA